MIAAKYRNIVFAFFNEYDYYVYKFRFSRWFFIGWMETYLKAFSFAFPIIFVVAPFVHKITNKLIK